MRYVQNFKKNTCSQTNSMIYYYQNICTPFN
uniref:Uncharacterized protein n=1 Tax=virus sp. ctmTa7 TaxID=2828255 RepID=A0A8S5RCI6_9VIRU|nr:MAG TPA: hypothetical protein [virus sp. ctmTa7]